VGATTVFVGAVDIPGAGTAWAGLAGDVDHANDNATDLAFALPLWLNRSLEDSVIATANLILHEAGHTWGLEEADPASAGDLMASGRVDRLLDAEAGFVQWRRLSAGDAASELTTDERVAQLPGTRNGSARVPTGLPGADFQATSRIVHHDGATGRVPPGSRIPALSSPRLRSVTAVDAPRENDDAERSRPDRRRAPTSLTNLDAVLDAVFADLEASGDPGSLFDTLLGA
jgi:hypothetical protein